MSARSTSSEAPHAHRSARRNRHRVPAAPVPQPPSPAPLTGPAEDAAARAPRRIAPVGAGSGLYAETPGGVSRPAQLSDRCMGCGAPTRGRANMVTEVIELGPVSGAGEGGCGTGAAGTRWRLRRAGRWACGASLEVDRADMAGLSTRCQDAGATPSGPGRVFESRPGTGRSGDGQSCRPRGGPHGPATNRGVRAPRPPVALTGRWQSTGQNNSSWADISGATGQTFALPGILQILTQPCNSYRVTATVHDNLGKAEQAIDLGAHRRGGDRARRGEHRGDHGVPPRLGDQAHRREPADHDPEGTVLERPVGPRRPDQQRGGEAVAPPAAASPPVPAWRLSGKRGRPSSGTGSHGAA